MTNSVLPKGVSKEAFDKAIGEYKEALGNENVLVAPEKIAPYSKIMIPAENSQHQPSGALLARSVKDVQEVLGICNKYRIPVWPISTGRNFGYGTAAPATPGQMVLDMRGMNKIIEIDPVLCTALVEPGVTYKELVDYINERNLDVWASFPSSGGLAGPVGNTLDRGVGYNRAGEHFSNFCGLEVVLANGEVVRTGMGSIGKGETWQSYRWGYGPWVDGLFSQSNLGVVTKMGLWLMKKPPHYESFGVGWNDVESMAKGVEMASRMRLSAVMENGVVGSALYGVISTKKRSDIYDGPGAIPDAVLAKYYKDHGIPQFALFSTLYGTKEQVAVNLKICREAFESTGGFVFTGEAFNASPDARHWQRMMTGRPELHEFGNYNFIGGGGSAWFAPALPARAYDVVRCYNATKEIFNKHGFNCPIGFLLGVRHLEQVADLLFDRTNPEETQRAHACFKEALEANAKLGYGCYRTNIAFMDLAAKTYSKELRNLNKRLKRSLDPNGIIAPGKSGIYI
ncbi:MAG: FAD-binding oxidoreductase [Oligoflexia bacterium]|nr:FAD-binding oxidoreductase [Oligoflexia bacterium]